MPLKHFSFTPLVPPPPSQSPPLVLVLGVPQSAGGQIRQPNREQSDNLVKSWQHSAIMLGGSFRRAGSYSFITFCCHLASCCNTESRRVAALWSCSQSLMHFQFSDNSQLLLKVFKKQHQKDVVFC